MGRDAGRLYSSPRNGGAALGQHGDEQRDRQPDDVEEVALDAGDERGVLADLHVGADPFAEIRQGLAAHLLGPTGDESLQRFRAAVDALAERAGRPAT